MLPKLQQILINRLPQSRQANEWLTWVACCGGVGYLPWAPGTWGSLLGILLYWWFGLSSLSWWLVGIILVVFTLLSVWLCEIAARHIGVKDPKEAVIDEVAGMWWTLWLVPNDLTVWVLAFLGFRWFDIFKPTPVRYFEEHCAGGWGIVMDDVAAGWLAGVIVLVASKLFAF